MAGSDISFTPTEVSSYYAARVPRLRQSRSVEWRGSCPIHDGLDENFAVDSRSGRWHCHSQCGRGGDIPALEQELTGADFPTVKAEAFRLAGKIESASLSQERTRRRDEWRETARYPYEGAAGKPIFEVIRREAGEGQNRKKSFVQCRRDAQGREIYNLDGIERVPFHLPRLLAAKPEEIVLIAEGEKCVEALEQWGAVATCNSGGSGSSKLFELWVDHFRGLNVVVLPDADAPGRKHAATVADILLPIVRKLRVVELPGLPDRGDIVDWQAGGGTREQLQAFIRQAPVLDRKGLAALRAQWALSDSRTSATEATQPEQNAPWPKPEPLQGELPPVQAFPEELLPGPFRSWAKDIAKRMQVVLDLPAVVLMLCLAGAVNRRAIIHPKSNDTGWEIVPNLWGGVIAPPGYLKSPVIQAATRPLNRIQDEWRNDFEQALKGFVLEREEHELRRGAWKEQYKANTKKGAEAPARPEDEPQEPKARRLIVHDATFEALHQTMSQNPAGVLAIRDELTGWLSQLDRSGREGERAFCLTAWNGDTGFTIDRIGRGTVHVPACCMSLLGGIQPGRLRSYLVDALEDGPSNDGLIQRFQLLVWPDMLTDWTYVDQAPDAALEAQIGLIFRKLVEMDSQSPARFHFAPDAQELFIAWLGELEVKVRRNDLHPALISHLSKYRSLMPSLALLLELAAGGEHFVTLERTRQAAAWCEYLESHARRVYSCVVTPQLRAARELAEKIKSRKIGAEVSFSGRDVYLKGWSGLDSPDAVKRAVEVLQDAGWLREDSGDPGPNGGRRTSRYVINPGVWE
jgi:hypothetical protein